MNLRTEIDHWSIQQNTATVQRSKEQATIGLCWSEFLYFPFNANMSLAILTTLALSPVTPHTFHPRRCCWCLQLVTLPLCEHSWIGSLDCRQELHATISPRCRVSIRLSLSTVYIALFLWTTNLKAVSVTPYYSYSCAFIP